MRLELDHFFVCTAAGAPESERLLEFSLLEGTSNQHPGQGTANRRFFLNNAFLELVWVADSVEVHSDLVRRTGLAQRWSQRNAGASPFGVGLRPAAGESGEPPFATWEYRPPYLPPPLVIRMAEDSDVAQRPLVFYLDFGRRADADTSPRRQPLEHPNGLRTITRLEIHSPPAESSASAVQQAVEAACPTVRFRSGEAHLAVIGFDDERQGGTLDLRPTLPMVLAW